MEYIRSLPTVSKRSCILFLKYVSEEDFMEVPHACKNNLHGILRTVSETLFVHQVCRYLWMIERMRDFYEYSGDKLCECTAGVFSDEDIYDISPWIGFDYSVGKFVIEAELPQPVISTSRDSCECRHCRFRRAEGYYDTDPYGGYGYGDDNNRGHDYYC
eukprot:TRINITY_DN633619_c0_g1_i3.p1 TRINITY_DN633619_c0_g1~~TRINITY_DN633619_c0_g1_i3.p1  ORF type:complete len:159 (+),score=12.55 TRINITY_DN633619_c0_g1_i3:2-478(+)